MRRLSWVWAGPGIMYFGKQGSGRGGGDCVTSATLINVLWREAAFFFFP